MKRRKRADGLTAPNTDHFPGIRPQLFRTGFQAGLTNFWKGFVPLPKTR